MRLEKEAEKERIAALFIRVATRLFTLTCLLYGQLLWKT